MFSKIKEDFHANMSREYSTVGLLIAYINIPAMRLLVKFRTAKFLYSKGLMLKVLAKIIWNNAVNVSGCYISLASSIEGGLRLPHPVGIVIGGGVIIHKNVTIYQHVTLGRLNQDKPEVPEISSGCIIYANSLIIGKVITEVNQVIPALTIIKVSKN